MFDNASPFLRMQRSTHLRLSQIVPVIVRITVHCPNHPRSQDFRVLPAICSCFYDQYMEIWILGEATGQDQACSSPACNNEVELPVANDIDGRCAVRNRSHGAVTAFGLLRSRFYVQRWSNSNRLLESGGRRAGKRRANKQNSCLPYQK